jgi:hypothetical protein
MRVLQRILRLRAGVGVYCNRGWNIGRSVLGQAGDGADAISCVFSPANLVKTSVRVS